MTSNRPNMLCRNSVGRNRRTWWYSVLSTPQGGTPEPGEHDIPRDEGNPETGDHRSDRPGIS